MNRRHRASRLRYPRPALEMLESRLTPSGPIPVGPEFQVNTYTTGHQLTPVTAVDANGDFVVAWRDDAQDGSGHGIYAQRYNASGVPQGTEFQVNTWWTGNQDHPAVAMDNAGDFVIAWTDYSGVDGSGKGVRARRYNSAGVPQGPEFGVNTYTTGGQDSPVVAIDAAGKFVVVWNSYGQNGPTYATIYGQRYDPTGSPVGNEFQVFSDAVTYGPHIAMAPSGQFVVTREPGRAVVYNSAGQPLGPDFQISPAGNFPPVAMDAQGNFVAIFGISGDPNTYARRFGPNGTPLGDAFLVIQSTTSQQFYPEIAMDAAGDFVVTWTDTSGRDGSDLGVYGRAFDSTGMPCGPDFRVNTWTTGGQSAYGHNIAVSSAGDFVIAWNSYPVPYTVDYGQDGSGSGVFAQRYRPAPPAVQSTQINNGAAQRSRVTSVTVNIDSLVTLPANPADAFQLRRQSDNALVGLTANVTNDTTTHVTLSFSGALSEFSSLADGCYTLTVLASQVSSADGHLDGNSDGTAGDNYTFNFHRLFGDADGNGMVSAIDFNAFRLTYGSAGPSIFDFNGDGQTSAVDFYQFGLRYGVTLVP